MSVFDILNKLNAEKNAAAAQPVEFIICGLGNPGLQYENTRHNAGFMAVDTIAAKYNTEIKKLQFKSLTGEVVLGGKKCLLMKPSTFMNNSGEAVTAAMQFYKIPIENVLVIYDDISLEPGKLRIRRKGSAGGHNGIKSIIYLTGEDTFPRIKLGVGAKPRPDYNLADWVLSNFKKDEIGQMHISCDNAAVCAELIVSGKTDEAMNKYNA